MTNTASTPTSWSGGPTRPERRGDLDAALRLRFLAGLVRLDDAGVVRLRPGLTNGAVSRTLRSPRLRRPGQRLRRGRLRRPPRHDGRRHHRPLGLADRRRRPPAPPPEPRPVRGPWPTDGREPCAGAAGWPSRPGALLGLAACRRSCQGGGGQGGGSPSSSFSHRPDGASAWAELLSRFGRDVDRLRGDLDVSPLDPAATVVVLDAPGLSEGEAEALAGFVRRGGHLVAGGAGAGEWLEAVVDDPPILGDGGARTAVPLGDPPAPEVDGVRTVRAGRSGSWEVAGQLRAHPQGRQRRGRWSPSPGTSGYGRVVALADPSPVQNALLAADDNAAFALGLAGGAGPPGAVRRGRPRLRGGRGPVGPAPPLAAGAGRARPGRRHLARGPEPPARPARGRGPCPAAAPVGLRRRRGRHAGPHPPPPRSDRTGPPAGPGSDRPPGRAARPTPSPTMSTGRPSAWR